MANKYVAHTRQFPPRCIRNLNPVPITAVPLDVCLHDAMLYFGVSCPCGQKIAHLLGYDCHSNGHPEDKVFLGPLTMECPADGQISELMNPDIHGHNDEFNNSCTRTGEGTRRRYTTPCGGQTLLELMPGFSYEIDGFDEVFAGREEAQRSQDFFDWFQLCGRCAACGSWHVITDFEYA